MAGLLDRVADASRSLLTTIETAFSADGARAGFRTVFVSAFGAGDDEALERTFAELDVNADGKVSRVEMREAIKKHTGGSIDEGMLAAMFDEADTDGDGHVSLDEVKAMLRTATTAGASGAASESLGIQAGSPVVEQQRWLADRLDQIDGAAPGPAPGLPPQGAAGTRLPPASQPRTPPALAAPKSPLPTTAGVQWPPPAEADEGAAHVPPATIGGVAFAEALRRGGQRYLGRPRRRRRASSSSHGQRRPNFVPARRSACA